MPKPPFSSGPTPPATAHPFRGDVPWLSIIGMGEDGPDGLSAASRIALQRAEIIIAPPRHLALLTPDDHAQRHITWPIPFADGLALLMGLRGQNVALLASGDPFWFGAGSVVVRDLAPEEWRAYPSPSTFGLAAAQMGWPLEKTLCIGLHAAPLARLRPHLNIGARMIVLLRDGEAVGALGQYLCAHGFGDSGLWVMEALGGPRTAITQHKAHSVGTAFAHPVCVALEISGTGAALPCSTGLPDHFFQSDGVMTKQPVRALTLSALAPRRGELLWDIGGGSGSVAIEWLLCDPANSAITFEPRSDRAALIRMNAADLGQDRLKIVEAAAPEGLPKELREKPPEELHNQALPEALFPNAIFIGGGLSDALLHKLHTEMPRGTRLVANAVTLEAEAILAAWQHKIGGTLLRIDLAQSAPLGAKRGWRHSYPIVQWSVIL